MAISFIGGTPPGRGDGTLEKHSEGVTFRRPSIRDGLNVSDCRPLLVALIASIPAAAQAPPRAPKPYAPVAITRPAASDDASFVAFRAALAAKAKPRIYAELAPLVLAQGFFWGRDFGHAFDPRKPAVDNLAAAIALEQGKAPAGVRSQPSPPRPRSSSGRSLTDCRIYHRGELRQSL